MITFKPFVAVQFCFTLICFIPVNAKYASEFNTAADDDSSFFSQDIDTSVSHLRTERSIQHSDCNCGIGSKGCRLENGKKICDCDSTISYAQFGDKCKFCDCGKNSKSCDFIDYRKDCKCERGYAPGNYGLCTQMCNETHKCINGGTCLQDVCICLPGTTGPLCQTITDCDSESPNSLQCGKNFNGKCTYDTTKAKAYCYCFGKDMKFDDYTRSCKECRCYRCFIGNCSENWKSCDFIAGEKTCLCLHGFSFDPLSGRCSPCDCGLGAEECKFDDDGLKTCKCKDGYLPKEKFCTKCDCGTRGSCKFEEREVEDMMISVKRCVCELGFEEYQGSCKECNSGGNGKCVFDGQGKKAKCDCDPSFAESSGKCQFCFCGPHASCSFKDNKKFCECPLGYENINGFCEDINECLNASNCRSESLVCLNIPGSFSCTCKPGYKMLRGSNMFSQCEEIKKTGSSGWIIAFGIVAAAFLAFMGVVVLRMFIKKRRNQIT